MQLTIDGVIFETQARGGISRLFAEILPRICKIDSGLEIDLLFETRRLQQQLPQHRGIRNRPIPSASVYLRPWRLWHTWHNNAQTLLNAFYAGGGKGRIWHSTYYTLPLKWHGQRVVTVYDMIHEHYPEFFNSPEDEAFRQQKRRCLTQADRVICISEVTRQDLLERYQLDEDRLRVVHLAAGSTFQEQSLPPPLAVLGLRPYLLYVGSREGYKNFDRLLEAYQSWKGRTDFDLVAVGGSQPTNAESQRLHESGLFDRIRFLGSINDDQLRALYHHATAFVYPSRYEGFGIPLLEAMACGCPVVASRIPTTVEVAGDVPIYFEIADNDTLLNALDLALQESPGSRRRADGVRRAQAFSWNETAHKTLAVYRDLL
jgi:glycosyltransferase involved in cell wall biosynthesis